MQHSLAGGQLSQSLESSHQAYIMFFLGVNGGAPRCTLRLRQLQQHPLFLESIRAGPSSSTGQVQRAYQSMPCDEKLDPGATDNALSHQIYAVPDLCCIMSWRLVGFMVMPRV